MSDDQLRRRVENLQVINHDLNAEIKRLQDRLALASHERDAAILAGADLRDEIVMLRLDRKNAAADRDDKIKKLQEVLAAVEQERETWARTAQDNGDEAMRQAQLHQAAAQQVVDLEQMLSDLKASFNQRTLDLQKGKKVPVIADDKLVDIIEELLKAIEPMSDLLRNDHPLVSVFRKYEYILVADKFLINQPNE